MQGEITKLSTFLWTLLPTGSLVSHFCTCSWQESLSHLQTESQACSTSAPFCHMFQFHKFGSSICRVWVWGFAILSISAWWKACFLATCSREMTKAPRLRFLQHAFLLWWFFSFYCSKAQLRLQEHVLDWSTASHMHWNGISSPWQQ